MISKETYTVEHIRDLQAASKGDPGLIERTLFAFGLLEALAVVRLDFTFKGETSLLLLLPHPKRLSTDIDVVVEPGTDISDFITRASEVFPFVAMEEQKRLGHNDIEKRYFKFSYESPLSKETLHIF